MVARRRRGGGVGKLFGHAPPAISVVPVTTTASAGLSTTTTTLFWSTLSPFFPPLPPFLRPRFHPSLLLTSTMPALVMPALPYVVNHHCCHYQPYGRTSITLPSLSNSIGGATAPPLHSMPQCEQGAMAPMTSQRVWHCTELKCK